MGSRCGQGAQGGDGVQVVDISNPQHPQVASTLPNPPFTRAEDVTVRDVHTPSFTGALAVVGVQACFGSGHEAEVVPGLRFFDVTPSAAPGPARPVGAAAGHHRLPRDRRGPACRRQAAGGLCRNLIGYINTGGALAVHIVDA